MIIAAAIEPHETRSLAFHGSLVIVRDTNAYNMRLICREKVTNVMIACSKYHSLQPYLSFAHRLTSDLTFGSRNIVIRVVRELLTTTDSPSDTSIRLLPPFVKRREST